MSKYLISITGDVNDGDYVERTTSLTLDELVQFKNILKKIREYSAENSIEWSHEYSDRSLYEMYPNLTDEEHEIIFDYIPRGEYGIHTITNISLYTVINHVILL